MKNIFTLALLGFTIGTSYAQTTIKAGTVQLGGAVGYSRNTQDVPTYTPNGYPITATYTQSQFQVAPSLGFFVADNLAVGINASYQISRTGTKQSNGGSAPDVKPWQLQAGAFVEYYKMLVEQFGFTGTLGGGYLHTDQGQATNTAKSNGFYAGLTPGIIFFPIPKIGIGASVGSINYSSQQVKNPGSTGGTSTKYDSSSFGANFGLNQLTFSGTYYFGR
jgi:hypothetical protein